MGLGWCPGKDWVTPIKISWIFRQGDSLENSGIFYLDWPPGRKTAFDYEFPKGDFRDLRPAGEQTPNESALPSRTDIIGSTRHVR